MLKLNNHICFLTPKHWHYIYKVSDNAKIIVKNRARRLSIEKNV